MFKLIVGLAILAVPGIAHAAPQWRVSETSGEVRLVHNGQSRAAARNALLASGAMIVTGPRAKAVIVRGEEFVVISPNSQLRVPTEQNSNGVMQIIADFGTALFKIKKKSTPHFGVQTPYLAAVVKGTTFTVTVGPEGGSVQVTEGAVEVSTLDGGARDLVTPGSIASVGASDLFQLSVQADDVKTLRSENAPAAGAVTSRVAPSAGAQAFEGPRTTPVEISAPIRETALSLDAATGGLVEGEAAIDVAMVQLDDRALSAARGPGSGVRDEVGNSGSGGGSVGSGAGDDGNNGHGNDDDRIDESNPASGGGLGNSGSGGGSGSGNSGSGNGNSGSGNSGSNNSGGGNSGSGGGNSGSGNSGNGNGNFGSGNSGSGNSGSGNSGGGNSGSGGGNSGSGGGNAGLDIDVSLGGGSSGVGIGIGVGGGSGSSGGGGGIGVGVGLGRGNSGSGS